MCEKELVLWLQRPRFEPRFPTLKTSVAPEESLISDPSESPLPQLQSGAINNIYHTGLPGGSNETSYAKYFGIQTLLCKIRYYGYYTRIPNKV